MSRDIRKSAALLVGALIIAVGAVVEPRSDTVAAQDRRVDSDAQRIGDATATLSAVVSVEQKAIPRAVLERAEGVAIFPSQARIPRRRGQGPNTLKSIRLLAVSGRGIVSVRGDSGTWSPPAFLTVKDGVPQGADLVLVIVNRRGLESMMKHEFEIDADAAVAPGPVGDDAQMWTDDQKRAEIFSYSRIRGVLAGLSLTGSTVQPDAIANQRFYGKPLTTARAVEQTSGPEAIVAWRAALEKHTARR